MVSRVRKQAYEAADRLTEYSGVAEVITDAVADLYEPLLREAYSVITHALFLDGAHPDESPDGSSVAKIREALKDAD